jgi:perosamine synthetase
MYVIGQKESAMEIKNRTINMADPFFTKEDRAYIHREIEKILDESLSMGPNVRAFEEAFAKMTGVRHAIAMNSCTSTLEAALIGLGIKQGDEVIVPCETFIATGMAVHLVGGRPVFAEISEKSFCLDIDDVKRRVNPHTRGIIMVYMGGLIPENILEFREFCDENSLFLIEDAAHAPGAIRNGKVAGSFGHAGCFSFFPTKVITAGEGGMLTTNDDQLEEFARSFQHRGRCMTAPTEQYCIPGRNVRMTELAALIGRIQHGHLQEFLTERRRVLSVYREGFRDDNRVRLIIPDVDEASSCWKIPLILADCYNRVMVTQEMHAAGISVDWAYHPALHLQPVFKKLYGIQDGYLPKSEQLLSQHICLPCHPRISNEDAAYVVDVLKSILSKGL